MLYCRSPSKRYARRTVGATTREAILEERNAIDGYRNTPHSQSVDNFRHVDGYVTTNAGQKAPPIPPHNNNHNMPNSTSYPGNQLRTYNNDANANFQHNNVRATLPHDYKHNDYITKTQTLPYSGDSQRAPPRPPANSKPEYRLSRSVESRSDQRSSRTVDNRSQKRMSRSVDARVNGENPSDE